jgi:hypothetical protein
MPDYEIIEWNEDNYDVNKIAYTAEAYAAKKYAFVSDYARFDILYQHGGLYFDTDVEVIKPFDDIVANGPFMGCEIDAKKGDSIAVAPGLGLGVNPGLGLYAEILAHYDSVVFLNPDGIPNTKDNVVTITTRILCNHGLKLTTEIQQCAGVWIYPNTYFSPKDIDTKKLTITEDTRSIHHYDATWAEWYDRAAGERGPKLRRAFGHMLGQRINVVIYCLQKYGLTGCLKKAFKKS